MIVTVFAIGLSFTKFSFWKILFTASALDQVTLSFSSMFTLAIIFVLVIDTYTCPANILKAIFGSRILMEVRIFFCDTALNAAFHALIISAFFQILFRL